MTKPARTMMLKEFPVIPRTSPATNRDTGMLTRLISAARQPKKKAARTTAMRTKATPAATVRSSMELSIEVAGLYTVEST